MIVTEAIRSRRTIFRFKPDPISDDNLEEILSQVLELTSQLMPYLLE